MTPAEAIQIINAGQGFAVSAIMQLATERDELKKRVSELQFIIDTMEGHSEPKKRGRPPKTLP